MNKSSESMRYFEDLLRSPRSTNDTFGLVYDKRGKSSSNEEKKNTKVRPTCHHCGKMGHTTNICRSKNVNHYPKKTVIGKSQKEGH